jgi:hypothetical protein
MVIGRCGRGTEFQLTRGAHTVAPETRATHCDRRAPARLRIGTPPPRAGVKTQSDPNRAGDDPTAQIRDSPWRTPVAGLGRAVA